MTPTLLELEDELGASIVNWTIRSTGQPLLRRSDQHALNTGLPGKLACYPLAPWSNRIAEGCFDCPVGLGFFCIEPVSHPVNAHHLPGRPGLRLLEQGQSQSAELGFSLRYRSI
jgi:aldose 1-epimerase